MLAAPGPALRIYRTADAALLANAQRELGAALFDLKEGDAGRRRFRVHPISGYLHFADEDALWTGQGGFPRDARDIEQHARAFLQEAAKRARGCRASGAAALPALFPEDLRPLWIGTVARNGGEADHALCQFAPYLPATAEQAGRVEGGCVEVRLGKDGKVIGLSTRWRPLAGETLSSAEEGASSAATAPGANAIGPAQPATVVQPRLPQAGTIDPPTASAHGHGHGDEAPPEYVFWLDDEDAPQTFLAPHLLALQGHHGTQSPAAQHSLVADILRRTRGEIVELMAEVTGGSGSFDYAWAAWQPAAMFDEGGGGLRPLGSGPTTSVESLECCVVLGVRDRLTGSVCQVERWVYPALGAAA